MKGKRKKSRPMPSERAREALKAYQGNADESPTDPLGSYTGRAEDGDAPVQDADDL